MIGAEFGDNDVGDFMMVTCGTIKTVPNSKCLQHQSVTNMNVTVGFWPALPRDIRHHGPIIIGHQIFG